MASSSSDSEDYLLSLETYLDAVPSSHSEKLREIPSKLSELEKLRQLTTCEKIVEILGTAVGQDKLWQQPFAENGILEHVSNHLDAAESSTGLAKQYLRVIGNCIADNDKNRARVLDHFPKFIACLRNESLALTALAVILNLCNDYDPAQAQAARLRLDTIIADGLLENTIPSAGIEYAVDLLTWTTASLAPDEIRSPVSVATFSRILDFALKYDEDHYNDYVAICAHYLQDAEFQAMIATPQVTEKLLGLIVDLEIRLDSKDIENVFEALKGPEAIKILPADSEATLLVQLINSLSAISATDAFSSKADMNSPIVKKSMSKIQISSVYPSAVSACVILGNMTTSDQIAIQMVQKSQIHLPLLRLLHERQETALLYAAAGFTRHLAFPKDNRRILGEIGFLETCCDLLANEDPSVRGEAAAILVKLVSDTFSNIKKIVYEAQPQELHAGSSPGVEISSSPTILSYMITQALAPSAPLPSTSMKNASIEIGRAIVSIIRYLCKSGAAEEIEPVLRNVYRTSLLARPVVRLVRQRFFPEARSEALFGLCLMVRSHEGAAHVAEEINEDPGILDALEEIGIADTKDGVQQDHAESSREQQNVFSLLHGLSVNAANIMKAQTGNGINALQIKLEGKLF